MFVHRVALMVAVSMVPACSEDSGGQDARPGDSAPRDTLAEARTPDTRPPDEGPADGRRPDLPRPDLPRPDTLQPDTLQPDLRPGVDITPAGDGAGGCYPEGAGFTSTTPAGKCCGKLVPVTDSKPSGTPGGCLVPKCPCYVCTNCGDGLCGKGENGCNCAKDCGLPCFSSGGKFQNWGADLNIRCCTGLSAIKDCTGTPPKCVCPSCPCYLCSACGNGKCESIENACNCPKDCP
jgi:hypothetical protein